MKQVVHPNDATRGRIRPGSPTRLMLEPGFLGYVGLHLSCLAVIWVGWSPVAIEVAMPALLAAGTYALGAVLADVRSDLGTSRARGPGALGRGVRA